MRNNRKALLALALIALLLLCACGRKEEPAPLELPSGTSEAQPQEQPAQEQTQQEPQRQVQEGSLDIQEPTATAAPVDGAASQMARRVDPDGRMIALTFDDGPGAGTQRILRALNDVDGRATFCMVGERLENYGDTAKQVAAQGSEIATHTWDHQDLTKLDETRVRRELRDSLDAIERTAGVRPTLLRPPYGSVNEEVKAICREMGLKIANWNVDPEDWKTRDAEDIRAHVLEHARDGAIVLCHDLYSETAEAMEGAIRELDARGYQLVTVSELLDARANGGKSGRVYYAA